MALITDPDFGPITFRIIGCALRVHSTLGPGVAEEAICQALAIELKAEGLTFERRVRLPVVYDGRLVGKTYEIDFIVADLVIVEVKSVKALAEIHKDQLRNYLKLSGKPAGLLINFNVPHLKDGIVRILNDKKRTG
jgi:GxxExxY protein